MRAERNTHTWDLKRARSGVDARHATVRTKVADHCTRVVGMIGRVQGLSLEQVQMAIALAVEGVIGYFGRAVHIDGPTCEKIERAIEEVLATRGWGAGRGAHRAARQKGGMGWTSVRAMAAAAYVSKVHRVLNGGDGEPAKVVLAKRIEQVVWRLAGRGDPLEWHPTHLKTILDGDDTVEAWLLCKLEAGVRTRRAAAQRTGEAGGAARVWARVKSGGMGPAVWEGNDWRVPFSRELAAAGVATLGDLHDGEGGVMRWDQARVVWGLTSVETYTAVACALRAQQVADEWYQRACAEGLGGAVYKRCSHHRWRRLCRPGGWRITWGSGSIG